VTTLVGGFFIATAGGFLLDSDVQRLEALVEHVKH